MYIISTFIIIFLTIVYLIVYSQQLYNEGFEGNYYPKYETPDQLVFPKLYKSAIVSPKEIYCIMMAKIFKYYFLHIIVTVEFVVIYAD